MFEKDYFAETEHIGPGKAGTVMGAVGTWGLHLAKVAFLIYSGYHGISATAAYRGESELAAVAGIFGIIVIEIVLFSLYLAWHNQRITGAAQSIAAAVTYAIGFILASLGIIADSQIHAGMELSGWLQAYLRWILPIAPAVMAFGALLTHELAPAQLRARKQTADLDEHVEQEFKANLAGMKAEMELAKLIRNMQLNAKASTARQIASWYSSEQAQKAISGTAMQNAPALLRAVGIDVADIPDNNGNGQLDPAEIADYLAQHPNLAAQLFALARDRAERDEQSLFTAPVTIPVTPTAATSKTAPHSQAPATDSSAATNRTADKQAADKQADESRPGGPSSYPFGL
jgi:hypothetical protein